MLGQKKKQRHSVLHSRVKISPGKKRKKKQRTRAIFLIGFARYSPVICPSAFDIVLSYFSKTGLRIVNHRRRRATSRVARRKLLCLPPPLLIGAIQQFATRRTGQSWSPPPPPPFRPPIAHAYYPFSYSLFRAVKSRVLVSPRACEGDRRGGGEETRKGKSRRPRRYGVTNVAK